jgi:hypothetical protein
VGGIELSANSFGKFIQLDAQHNTAAYRLILNVFLYSYIVPFIIQWLSHSFLGGKKNFPLTEKINYYNPRNTKLRQQVASNKHKCPLHVNTKSWDTAVSISKRLRTERPRNSSSTPPASTNDLSLLQSIQNDSAVLQPLNEYISDGSMLRDKAAMR